MELLEQLTGHAGHATTEWHDYPSGGAHTVVGTVKVSSAEFGPPESGQRHLLVYLPPSYAWSDRRYPVIYMHDGQNLFDAATSFSGEWHVDATMEALSGEGIEAIIVGIPNAGPQRTAEYSPFPHPWLGGGRAASYIHFLTDTVKPLIDQAFRTQPDRAHTGTAGSSLGGLVSLYAFFAAPLVFGFAGVFSPALWSTQGKMAALVQQTPFIGGRLYMDVGDQETPGGSGRRSTYLIDEAQRMAALLRAKGYPPADLQFHVALGGQHNETSWAARLPGALRFLLAGQR
ncbi:MAG: alpha/beta hydrolase-fold protein [Chloroflexota bacterium]|nr:alpha/beta hydrolase-fold protein [Chloroflexota bacterium]